MVRSKLLNHTINRTTGHAYAVCVTIFRMDGKLHLVSDFMELHTFTLAARSYALLLTINTKTADIFVCV